MNKLEKLYRLFVVTFSVSATTSGGHAITAVLKPIFIEKYHWINEDELLDLIAIGQITPGSIAINVSVILGYRVVGFAGAFVAMLGTTIPPFVLMLLVTFFYESIVSNVYVSYFLNGMQAGVTALIAYVTYDSFIVNKKDCSLFGYAIMLFSILYALFSNLSLFYLVIIVLAITIIRTIYVVKKF